MMSGDGDIVCKASEDELSEELSDDEVLIKAYSRAVSTNENELSLSKLPSTSSTSRTYKHQKKKNSKKAVGQTGQKSRDWKVGDFCKCTYSVDGRVYEAKIKSIDQDTCTVHYVGYGNEEEVYLSELLPSEGKFARQKQTEQAERENAAGSPPLASEEEQEAPADHTSRSHDFYHHQPHLRSSSNPPFATSLPPMEPVFNRLPPFMRQAVPPPPPICHGDLPSNDEALASMLMSWYMTGYHTGYYQGLQESKQSKTERCCCKHSCHK